MKRLILFVTTLLCLAAPATAFAYNPLTNACNANTGANASSASSACSANGSDPITGTNGVLKKVSIVLAGIAGITAVIIIIVSGLQFVLSNGDSQKAAKARTAIIGAAVGLVIIAAAEGIITFVLSKL